MEYIGFASIREALQWREHNGGWLFTAADNSEFIWFSLKFTPAKIMLHRATQGLSGTAACRQCDFPVPTAVSETL
jgi:hypothetical protein